MCLAFLIEILMEMFRKLRMWTLAFIMIKLLNSEPALLVGKLTFF